MHCPADGRDDNRWYLDPVLKGEYPADVAEWFEERQILPDLPMEDLAILLNPLTSWELTIILGCGPQR